MRTRIGTRVIAGAGLVTALSIGLMAVLVLGAHERDLTAERKREADQFSETIKSSTHYDMLENRRDGLHRQIETIGRQEGIERVRVFNKEGVVMFSSDAAEIGQSVDKETEACYACHAEGHPLEKLPLAARTRVFRSPEEHRVLGIINPIQNEPSCSTASCHAHATEQSVLGVLDVMVSLQETDQQIRRGRTRMIELAVLTILAISIVLWWLNRRLVIRPVRALAAGTRAVAEGDLTTTIAVSGNHELGDLARAFNGMTRKLAEARFQIIQAEKLASVGRLASGVAHEINNPLTGILTYGSLLLKQNADRPELKEDLEVIVRETKRCREIVKGLLDFARQTPPKRQSVNVNEAIRRAVAVLMNQLRLDSVELTLDLEKGIAPVFADGNQIQQVVTNLLLNAVDAIGPDGGRVWIRTRCKTLSPLGNAEIHHAACPAGCDLLDPQTKIGVLSGIRVVSRHGTRESIAHLDPIYGRFNHLAREPWAKQSEASFLCPDCRTSLDLPDGCCPDCGAGTFAVVVAGEGRVEWCRRQGCRWSRWERREAQGPRRTIEIEVGDSGKGMSPDTLAHVFEPFFTTKGTHGTGLGLAVSWGIIKNHGGRIDVENEPGQGVRFIVRLPAEMQERQSSAA